MVRPSSFTFSNGEEAVPYVTSTKGYPTWSFHQIASGCAWQSWAVDFGIFILLLAWLFITLQFWNTFSWYIWKFQTGKVLSIQNFTNYPYEDSQKYKICVKLDFALLPHVLYTSTHPIWSCSSYSKFQDLTFQPYSWKS